MKNLMTVKMLLLFLSGSLETVDMQRAIKNDNNLIGPGLGAEKIVLNENADMVISAKGYPGKVSEFEERKELFKDVFKINLSAKIFFDKIYYYETKKTVILLDRSHVSGIVGFSNRRVTVDSVNLGRGVEYFVFGYGNKNLEIIKKKNDKTESKIYLYLKLGIVIVDDRSDDIIDMFIVFPAVLN